MPIATKLRAPIRRALCVAALLAATAVQGAVAATTPVVETVVTTQLPRGVTPRHYDIALVPDAANLRFAATTGIDLDVTVATDRITMNAADLTFASATLTDAAGKARVAKISVDAKAETATFAFDAPLAPGKYRLETRYTGIINTQGSGLFALDYDSAAPGAAKTRALFSQFENSFARHVFPGWDEPFYKATFTLTATVPTGQLAVSNMPAAGITDIDVGRSRVTFPVTPRMSTYLLFFGLGDFDRAHVKSGATDFGVVTRKGAADQAQFALDSSVSVLNDYNRWFAVPYPLPKLDQIAGPGRSQFFGAMENWGAIFSYEYAILLDPRVSTQSDRESVFEISAHEIAHQWFGDLVTMAWWDDLWLNEGFATWMAGDVTQRLHPEWQPELGRVEVRESGLTRDAVATTHPVVQHIVTVEQASQAFDDITYQKGATVIGMLQAYVGADAWQAGVRRYIKAHAYGNAVSDDLWHAVDAGTTTPITAIAHQFTLQPGVPLIRVAATCVAGATEVRLTQGEFTSDRPGKTALAWDVPVIAAPLGKPAVRTLVRGGSAKLDVPGCAPLIVNAGQSGYFRTLYDPAAFAAIAGAFGEAAPVDQLGILHDTWALGSAGLQPASDILSLVRATPVSADPQVWSAIADVLDAIDGYYGPGGVVVAPQAAFRTFATAALRPVLARTGWAAATGEATSVANLRATLIRTLAGLGDTEVIIETQRRWAAQASDPAAVPVALRKTIQRVVAVNADAATWDALHVAAQREATPQSKDHAYLMLGLAADAVLAQRALALALTAEPGATNSAAMIRAVSAKHPDKAFDFAAAHIAQLDLLIDVPSRTRYYAGLASGSSNPAMIAKLNAYADAHLATGSRRPVDTAIAAIESRIMVHATALPQIDHWLAAAK